MFLLTIPSETTNIVLPSGPFMTIAALFFMATLVVAIVKYVKRILF